MENVSDFFLIIGSVSCIPCKDVGFQVNNVCGGSIWWQPKSQVKTRKLWMNFLFYSQICSNQGDSGVISGEQKKMFRYPEALGIPETQSTVVKTEKMKTVICTKECLPVVSSSVVSDSMWPVRLLYSPSGSSVHGIFQARILEWVAISFSRGSSDPGTERRSTALQADSLPVSHRGSPLRLLTKLKVYKPEQDGNVKRGTAAVKESLFFTYSLWNRLF